jgi:predicted glycoside hydrolase/deacetylase ChbG (UPF0249 family)
VSAAAPRSSLRSRRVSGRYLIVNADDFGQSSGINQGIVRAYEHGVVTSASLMVRWSSSAQAAAYARIHPDLSVGLHVDLGEWAHRDGTWEAVYEVVSTQDAAAVRQEVANQLAAFRRLVGRDPTHIDAHQHVHRSEPVQSVALDLAVGLGVPLRDHSPDVRYVGDFYGQTGKGSPLPRAITVGAMLEILAELPAGITELGCHPGEGRSIDSTYGSERERELEVLCDPRVRRALAAQAIELASFRDVAVNLP